MGEGGPRVGGKAGVAMRVLTDRTGSQRKKSSRPCAGAVVFASLLTICCGKGAVAQYQTLQITLTLPPGVQGAIYNAQVSAAGGIAPYSASITSGALPPGLNLVRVDASTGAITGTPSAMGTFPFTLSITDATRMSASRPLSLTVAGPQGGSRLRITSSSRPRRVLGHPAQS